MICPTCQREMRIVSLIDERDVIVKMLKCLGLWQQGVRVDPQQQLRLDIHPSIPHEYHHGRIPLNPETAFRRDHAKSDFLSINRLSPRPCEKRFPIHH